MFEIVALICAMSQPLIDCTLNTARSVYKLGEQANELACMRQAQMSDGRVTLKVNPDEYKKYICVRPHVIGPQK